MLFMYFCRDSKLYIILPRDGTSRDSLSKSGTGKEVGRDNHYFSIKIRDGTRDGMGQDNHYFFSENGINVQN